MKIKFEHLRFIFNAEKDPLALLHALTGFKRMNTFQKVLHFPRLTASVNKVLEYISGLNIEELESEYSGDIILPEVDAISYRAKLEIESKVSSIEGWAFTEILDCLSIACYQEFYGEPFKSGFKFLTLRSKIQGSEAIEILGMFNLLVKKLSESNSLWSDRFNQVRISDPDFTTAGGASLDKFGAISTIKSICGLLNMSYDGVWDLQYGILQTTLLDEATKQFIEKRMADIKKKRADAKAKIK